MKNIETCPKDYIKINLKTTQTIYFERFKEIHRFLCDNNIKYFCVGGTALGAVREKGFIPWDDDIDIGMLRSDYEKFIKCIYKLDKAKFEALGCRISNSKVEHGLVKIAINGTYKETNLIKGLDHRFHIDVFPYDAVSIEKKQMRKDCRKRNAKRLLLYFKNRKKSSSPIKSFFLKVLQFLLLPFSSQKIAFYLDKCAKNCTETYKNPVYITNFMGRYSYHGEMVPASSIGSPILADFENTKFFIPENSHDFLKSVYGENYMKPANKRINVDTFYAFASMELLNDCNYEKKNF